MNLFTGAHDSESADPVDLSVRDEGATGRTRRARPPVSERNWLLASELYSVTGMSEATINRHARGELLPRLPSIPCGRRGRIFRKETITEWLRDLEATTK